MSLSQTIEYAIVKQTELLGAVLFFIWDLAAKMETPTQFSGHV